MMIKAITSLFLLSLCVHTYANTERVLLCDGAGREDKYEFPVPCALVAKTVKLENKSINNGILYATNSGFYFEAPPGFVSMGDRLHGVFFKYSEEKWIDSTVIRWRYDRPSLTIIKYYDEIYKIDRGDMQIFFYQHIDEPREIYTAFVIHKDTAEDILYMIDSMGFTLAEFKQVLATIRLIEPD